MLDSVSQAPTVKGIYIDGTWQPTARQFDDLNPSDGSLWARIPDATADDTRRAIEAARRAFPAWAGLKFQERADYMLKIAEVIAQKAPEFIAAAQFEGGGWYGKGVYETKAMPEIFKAAAGLALTPEHEGIRMDREE